VSDAATDFRVDVTGWRSIEFASDLHLCEEAPRTFEAFKRWLESSSADAVFILGDLFDVWIGDDTRQSLFSSACLEVLARTSDRIPVYFLCGNRDFLLGPLALSQARITALPDPFSLNFQGRRLLLSHGDALCLSDVDYLRFRSMVRDSAWQSRFLAMPLPERAALAQRIRTESQGRKTAQPDRTQWPDVEPAEARRWLQRAGARTLVHGHTHRPGWSDLGDGMDRRVLSDWDWDSAPFRGTALRLDGQGWHPQG
jgi:UDP-2,3-diacylglucosamine hydrolase